MAKRRDSAVEYERRIERGLARGLTRAEARGHAEESREALPVSTWGRIEAAADEAVSSTFVRGPFGPGGKWGGLYVAVDEKGKETTVFVKDIDPARLVSRLKGQGLPEPTIDTP